MTATLEIPELDEVGDAIQKPKNELKYNNKLGVIELFSGAGGLAQGFLRTEKYDLIGLTDIETNAKATFELNYPSIPYIASDIHDLEPEAFIKLADGRKIVGVLGGPPCQGFSLAGLKNPDDLRNQYVKDYIKFVKTFKPDFLLMENVPQFFFHPVFNYLLKELKATFAIKHAVLNAAQYGTPQTRHRAFVIAYNRRLGVAPSFPTPTHGFVKKEIYNYCQKTLAKPKDKSATKDILGAGTVLSVQNLLLDSTNSKTMKSLVTIADAIGDLIGLESGETSKSYINKPSTLYQRQARKNSTTLFNHTARRHDKPLLELINSMPEGGDLADVDSKYWPKSHYSQAYGRLHNQGLSRTLTTFFCNPGSGRYIHPVDARTITVREAARLQGFSDNFIFLGDQSAQMKLVGNAVPITLAKIISEHIHNEISSIVPRQ